MSQLAQRNPDEIIVANGNTIHQNHCVINGHLAPAPSSAPGVLGEIPLRSLGPCRVHQVHGVNVSDQIEGSAPQVIGTEAVERQTVQHATISDQSRGSTIIQFATTISCALLGSSPNTAQSAFCKACVQPWTWLWRRRPAAANLLLALAGLVIALVGLIYVVLDRRSAMEALDLTKWTAWKDYKVECREEEYRSDSDCQRSKTILLPPPPHVHISNATDKLVARLNKEAWARMRPQTSAGSLLLSLISYSSMSIPLVLVGAYIVRWIYSGSYKSVFRNRKRSTRAQTQNPTSPDSGHNEHYLLDLEAAIGSMPWEDYSRLDAKHKAGIDSIPKPPRKPKPKPKTLWRPAIIETMMDASKGRPVADRRAELLLLPVDVAIHLARGEEYHVLVDEEDTRQSACKRKGDDSVIDHTSPHHANLPTVQSSSSQATSPLSSSAPSYTWPERILTPLDEPPRTWLGQPLPPYCLAVDAPDGSRTIMRTIAYGGEEAFPGYATGVAHDLPTQARRRRQ